MAADPDGHARRAGDGALCEIDGEAVLGEQSTGSSGFLGLAARVDAGVVQAFLECPGSIGVVAVDGGGIVARRSALGAVVTLVSEKADIGIRPSMPSFQ